MLQRKLSDAQFNLNLHFKNENYNTNTRVPNIERRNDHGTTGDDIS